MPSKPRSLDSSRPPRNALQIVDPRWLLKALALTLLASVLCVYGTLCLLVYRGAWQFVLHPSRTIDRIPANAGLAFDLVRFGAADTGQPRLTAWWIPAQSAPSPNSPLTLQTTPKYAAYTVLYLHDGSGSLSDTLPTLTLLHQAGINVFAIDYRGFGASDATDHPSQSRMVDDTAAAFSYLTATRHLPARSIVPYGSGLGAFPAADLAHTHPEIPAVILDNPIPDPAAAAGHTRAARILPLRLLLGHPFDIASAVSALATPKLLIAGGPGATDPYPNPAQLQALFQQAASPRFTATLPPGNPNAAFLTTLDRFLDEYLPPR